MLAHFALGRLLRHQAQEEEAGRHFDIALQLLEDYAPEAPLPESDGLSAARLQTMIRSGAARKERTV